MMKRTVGILMLSLVLVWLLSYGQALALQKPAQFSGDLVITAPDATIKAKLYVKNPSVHRVEILDEGGGVIFIRPPKARGRIWMLDPANKQYRILSWPQVHKDPVQAWTDIRNDMGGGSRAEEAINGYPCTVAHFQYPGEDRIALTTWFAEDLQYAIKRQADAQIAIERDADPVAIKGIFEVLNIQMQELDEDLFEVPPDYEEVK